MMNETNIDALIRRALDEDLSRAGDITSLATIPETAQACAVMNAREAGRLAGVNIAARVFEIVDDALDIQSLSEDGQNVSAGTALLRISGNARYILQAERTALNIVSHLSGIATKTAAMVALLEGTKARLLDTRKTLPGLRALQKYAIKMGGGVNHRLGLYDAVLIKDNHIAAAGGVKPALDGCALYEGQDIKIEIEVDTFDQLQEVLDHGGADIVLLDNFTPEQLTNAVALIDERLITEYSGRADETNIAEIAKTGVDFISSGALTHSVKILDIGLDFTK